MERRDFMTAIALAQIDLESSLWNQHERDAAALAQRIANLTLEDGFADLPEPIRERAHRLSGSARQAAEDIRRNRIEHEDNMRRMAAMAAAQAEFDAAPEQAPLLN